MRIILSGLAVAAVSATAAMADFTDQPPSYVDLVPLSDVVSTSFQNAPTQSTLQAPMIDWSGDFITVHANGGTTTAPDSWMDIMGVSANLYVENDLVRQLTAYMNGDSPFMRLTQGQAVLAAPITEVNDETQMVAIYQHSFSQGDHLVARAETTLDNICDANIAIMLYGPHTDFMGRLLTDAGCDIEAMQNAGQINWMENLTGENSPYHALVSDPNIDAAFVVTPDMLALTSGDAPGSHVPASTRELSRAISDVYVVRRDYFLSNQEQIQNFVHALFLAGEEFDGIMAGLTQTLDPENPVLNGDQQLALAAVAQVFPDATADGDAIEAGFFYLDANISGYPGNVRWADETNPRGWMSLNNEVQTSLAALGLSDRAYTIYHAAWDYSLLTEGLANTDVGELPAFNASAVAAFVGEQQRMGALETGELFSFEIFFGSDQTSFPIDQYEADFRQLVDFAQAYGGAIITVEGHSDPLGYLMAVDPARFGRADEPASRLELRQQLQSLRNLSTGRATSAREALLAFAEDQMDLALDPSQFTIVSHGIDDPNTGICGDLPCAPANEAEWLSNMRVVWRIIAVPSEAQAFIAARD